MASKIEQPSLFDEPAPEPIFNETAWHEVPAALFLSWSDARQLEYCARRDEETMMDDISDWWMDFYAIRAVTYRRMVKERS